jgi:TRAP-type C4-dicarboxylate transport system permease small subunit
MPMLQRALQALDGASRPLAVLGGWFVLGLSFLIGVEVVGRKSVALAIQGSDEIGGYVMAVSAAFGFSYALAKRGHIRLNLVLPHMPAGFQVFANMVAYVILAAFSYLMLWQMADMLLESLRLKAVAPTPLQTPLALPQFLCVLGLGYFAAHTTVYVLEGIRRVASGDVAGYNRLFGVETAQQEAESELKDTQIDVR